MATLHMAGDDFVTDGERRLAEVLRQLPPDWVIIANKMLPVMGAASREIDFIVLGDQLVFVLDEKGYGGRIVGTDQQWTLADGSSQRSPLNKLEYSAKLVAGRLRKAIPSFADQNAELVVSGVVLSRTEQRPSLRDPRAGRSVMLLDEVVDRLTEWDAAGPVQLYKGARAPEASADYVRHQRRHVSQTLYDLSTRPKIPRQVNDYEIVSHWEGPAGARIFLANHAFGGERILSMYQIGSDSGKRQFVAH